MDAPNIVLTPIECMQHVQQAINAHDLDALTACFDADYDSQFPAHPDRAFRGHTQMRNNWSQILSAVPDIQATLIRSAENGDTVWSEWEWQGTRLDGASFLQRGVTIQGVSQGLIIWARLYLELVQQDGAGSDAAVRRTTTGKD
jgi:ketosteroid isomerase-like protein